MSLESSYEHAEQEPPRSATSAETGQNPVIQEENEREQFSANVILSDGQEMATYQAFQDPATLDDVGVAALHQYWASGQVADLNRAIECWHEALNLIPSDSSYRTTLLNNLGTGLRDRYARTGKLTDLEAAVNAYQQAVQATSPDLPYWTTLLNNLGTVLCDRYARTGKLTDLEAAIDLTQQAVRATPSNSPNLPIWLNNLGNGLSDRYRHTGELADLEAAIKTYQQAVRNTSPDSLHWPALLNNLGNGLSDRYRHTGELADLEVAIKIYQQVVQVTSSNSPFWPTRMSNIGAGLLDRYRHTGELADLEAAIKTYQQVVRVTPSNSPDLAGWLSDLGAGLRDRYARTGKLTDLEAAIDLTQQAVRATPSNSPNLPIRLNNLGTGLRDRYRHTGELADLEAAIKTYRQAVRVTPSNSPDLPGWLNNLGTGLHDRYIRTRELADLEAAIKTYQQAVRVTPSNSPDLPGWLNNLGIGLRDRYVRARKLTDLEAAISAFQQAVRATPSNSPNLPIRLNNLGTGLLDRYTRTRELADLEAAIDLTQQVVRVTPSNSPNLPIWLNNLGTGLRDRYRHTGELADLEAAIKTYQQALQATPPDSPHQPTLLNNLGTGLLDRYRHAGELADLEAAITAWEKSWSMPHSSFAAFPVTYQLGQQHQGAGIAASLIGAYVEQAKLRRPHAPNVLIRILEIAEGSKSRLLTHLIGRVPLTLPAGLSQEIAVQELQLLTELTALDIQELAIRDRLAPTQEENDHLQCLQQRQAVLRRLDELWAHIARVGPEGTAYVDLRRSSTPTWRELANLAKVLGSATALLSFFTTADRAFFFLLRAGWRVPRVVEISLNQIGWADLLERFFREVHRYGPGLRRSETWDQSLHPLLTKAQRHLEGVERLILAPASNGHLLPWGVLAERAEWHTSTGQPLPLVTLPSLSILSRLRQRPHVPLGPALVVGNPLGDLPHTEAEANVVAKQFGTKPLLGPAATKSDVVARFSDATLIHLATHAFFDADNPLESGIVLADGVLTAREVLQHRLQADLLVLSACESGRVGSLGGEELAGLSQAFLQIGVRSLLVSLWQVNDPATAALIQAFYIAWQAGADKALALRQAMTQIQQDPRWTHPYYWGAFVLMGDWD